MPELPDVTIYVRHLERRLIGATFDDWSCRSPFLLRTFEPSVESLFGRKVVGVERLGKRIAIELDAAEPGVCDFLLIHLMIAGRFLWRELGEKVPESKIVLASLRFSSGVLVLTEAGSKKRASLCVVRGRDGLNEHDRGGLDVLSASLEDFHVALTRSNHTLKRVLTDPTVFDGIGNAYSDEILFHARLSPVRHSQKLDDDEIERLFEATRRTLRDWIDRLAAHYGDAFPTKVTAFRPEMAVHGKFREPCPDCGAPVQRIVYATNETNYCAGCQNGGKLLKDRALSRLLKNDWPKSLDEL